jgi:diadenosine tetraphosphatase ApaH/serine/threonine PP2A family protein phosphatase
VNRKTLVSKCHRSSSLLGVRVYNGCCGDNSCYWLRRHWLRANTAKMYHRAIVAYYHKAAAVANRYIVHLLMLLLDVIVKDQGAL